MEIFGVFKCKCFFGFLGVVCEGMLLNKMELSIVKFKQIVCQLVLRNEYWLQYCVYYIIGILYLLIYILF